MNRWMEGWMDAWITVTVIQQTIALVVSCRAILLFRLSSVWTLTLWVSWFCPLFHSFYSLSIAVGVWVGVFLSKSTISMHAPSPTLSASYTSLRHDGSVSLWFVCLGCRLCRRTAGRSSSHAYHPVSEWRNDPRFPPERASGSDRQSLTRVLLKLDSSRSPAIHQTSKNEDMTKCLNKQPTTQIGCRKEG